MDNQITAPAIVGLFQTTQAQRDTFVTQVVDAVTEGHLDPLRLKVQLKAMEAIIESISKTEEYKKALMEEAAKYPKNSEAFGAAFAIRSAAGKYDYSNDAECARLEAELKARKDYLKALPAEGKQVLSKDGELILDLPPKYSPGADTIFITLK